jgi:endonuclease VIII
MPEGDTIHKLAARIRPVLEGATLVRFEAPRLVGTVRPRPGMGIESVGAHGKHLLVRFERDLVLEVHLGMVGSWQLARTGERLRKPPHLVRALVGVEGWDAVFFTAPTVRAFVDRGGAPTPISHLGPDLAVPDPDLGAALARMATIPEPGTSIAEVLLDQRVAAGIGNVFKSEVLWAEGVDPFAPIGSVPEDTRLALLTTGAAQLAANLRPGRRRTTVPGGLAVYGRARRPCLRCGTPIRMRRHGEQARSTYWCPSCQG